MIDVLYTSPWPGALLWAMLFVSDFSFTLTCARMYKAGVRERLVFEGSYELTPYHQRDIDALRRVSPRFLFALGAGSLVLVFMWQVTVGAAFTPVVYEVALGALIMLQLTIHVRHLRNFFLFRSILAGGSVTGRIEYARPAILAHSAVELFAFAGLYAIVWGLTTSGFVLGGAFACALVGAKHSVLARQAAVRTAVV